MINIEVMYPEYMNLYGDTGNIKFLEKCLNKKAKVHFTNLNDEPKFIKKDIDILYFGPSTEKQQEEIIKKLLPYKKHIKKMIDKDKIILAIGNAQEIFGQYILDINNKKIKGLEIFDFYSKREANYRYNELCIGITKDDIKIVGFKNQMSHIYTDIEDDNYFQKMILGKGRNRNTNIEGININNFFGTYIIGPILILNPKFTKFLLNKLGFNETLLYEKDLLKAYDKRLLEFEKLVK
ncbi:MAG TPA: hypothetical protein PKY25_03680 [Bacilli bacterium]|nr:hypothetical protein [Bacilli bacterium]